MLSGGGWLITVRDCVAPADLDAAWRIRALAFGGPREQQPNWTDGGWRGWVAELDGRACGFARAWPYRQFFGGRAVPMAGLASVAVDPHARGRGVASALLTGLLPALRADGYAVSTLYASIVGLYRACGWEQAGLAEWVEMPLAALRDVPPPAAAVPLRPATADDVPAVHACYLTVAREVDGLLDRSTEPFEPSRLLELDVVTVAGDSGGLRGYLSAHRGDDTLVVYDVVALDADARLALLRSLASWAGQLSTLRMRLLEPRALQPVALGPVVNSELWMLRVVDLPVAVAARGWPRAALLRTGLSVDVDVVDEHAPWHAGPHRLVVDGPAVVLSRGGSGAVQITARGLAAWYAGVADTAALSRAGQLSGDRTAATVLDALTGTPGPARLADAF